MTDVSEQYFLNKVDVALGIYKKIPVILFQTQSKEKYLGSYHHIIYITLYCFSAKKIGHCTKS